MINFHSNIDSYVGLFLVLCSLCILILPPKYKNVFYGFTTKWTLKNEIVWAAGQKLFAISIILIGIIFLAIGNLKLGEGIPQFPKVLLLIALWTASKYFVHKALEKKYPNF